MNPLDLLAQPVWQHGTWALAHFLWQGCAIALAYVAFLHVVEWRSAQARYAAGLVALAVMALCVPATFAWLAITADPSEVAVAEATPASSLAPATMGDSLGHREASTAHSTTASASAGETIAIPVEQLLLAAHSAQPYIAAAWLAGVTLFGLWLLISFAGVAWLTNSARELPAGIARVAERVARRLGIAAPIDVYLSDRVSQATAVGFLRPLVLLPAAWVVQLDVATLESVIAHELAHVRRWDLWVNLLQRCLETMLFYHPAVWWLSSQVRATREMCCDEMAAEAAGDRAGYVAALVQVAHRQVAACAPLLGAGMGGDNMALLERARYVLGLSPEGENGRWWPVGLAALALPAAVWLGTLGFGGSAVAEDGDRPKEGVKEGDRPKEKEVDRPKEGDQEAIRRKLGERGAAIHAEIEKVKAAIGQAEGRVREAIANAKTDAEAKAIKERAAAQIGEMRAHLKAMMERAAAEGRELGLKDRPAGDRPIADRAEGELARIKAAAAELEGNVRQAIANAKSDAEVREIKERAAARMAELKARAKAITEGAGRDRPNVERERPFEGREPSGQERELAMMVRQLQAEVMRLRAELSELRGRGEGDRKPEIKREGDRPNPERKPEVKRDGEGGDRKPLLKEGGDRKPEARKEGDRKPDAPKEGDRKPEARKEGDRKPDAPKDGDRKPEGKREGDRPDGDRKPEAKRDGEGGDRKPDAKREDGAGLRISVPAIGPAPIALDFAFPMAKAAGVDGQIFSFFVGLIR